MLSPFGMKDLEEGPGAHNFPISRKHREFFPNDKLQRRAAKMHHSQMSGRMSLRGQFFLSAVLALLLSLSVLGVVACWHARASVDNEMAMALEAGDRIVDNALLSLPRGGEETYLERLVRSFDGNRHIRVALMEHGHEVVASQLAAPDAVPLWYQRLLEIPTQQRIDTAPRLGGRSLHVTTDAHNEIGEAWTQFRDGATILALFCLLMLGLLHLAMARIAASLKKLGDGFEAVGSGDYAARVAPKGPREISALAGAFNRMAARLNLLEDANRRLTGQMLAIQEEERADLARDLHDEMGPFLFAMRLDAEAIEAEAKSSGQGAMAERAHALGEAVSRIQSHVRSILKQLRPDGLAEIGLAVAIGNLATFWQRRHGGIAIHLDIAAQGFSAEVDATLYRLVQESLTNAARHGAAHQVWIAITDDAQAIQVTVEDDGVGISSSQESGGMGLKGMRERLTALNGRLTLGARSGGGTRLTAVIPKVRAKEVVA
jgi:two-component system, NarL family, sensor histidine kinase UhpB